MFIVLASGDEGKLARYMAYFARQENIQYNGTCSIYQKTLHTAIKTEIYHTQLRQKYGMLFPKQLIP